MSVIPYGRFKFHPVGQGLFYTGEIEYGDDSFVFVYDCGGTNRTIASDAAGRFIDSLNGKKIDMLVLSHLHEDHINGIETILRALKPGGRIVMPYIDSSLQLLYQYEFSGRDSDDEFLGDFYDDPIGIISEITENKVSIYMVSSIEPDFSDTYYTNERSGEDHREYIELHRSDEKESSRIYLTKSYASSVRMNDWVFRITQPFFDDDTYKNTKKILEKYEDLSDLLKNKEETADLKELNKYQNKSCLLMDHWFCYSCLPSESILTGDLEETGIQEYRGCTHLSERPFVLQIPHHGASAIPSITNSVFSVVSYGIGNNYKHPYWITLKQYLEAGSKIVGVNENTGFCMKYCNNMWIVDNESSYLRECHHWLFDCMGC